MSNLKAQMFKIQKKTAEAQEKDVFKPFND